MKHLLSGLSLFCLVGSALLLPQNIAFSQSLNPSLNTTSVPQKRKVQVRVELLDVKSLDQQEFFGADEFFALWVFSVMRDGPYDSRLYRAETHFGVSQPVSIKNGERKNIPAGTVVFDDVITEASVLSGNWRAMEEDESRNWNDVFRDALNAEMLGHINDEKNMRESTINSDARPATNEDLARWTTVWWNRSVRRTHITGFEDLDDIIATTPLEIPATGPENEERSWKAQGDGAIYDLRYRITRTPLSPPPPAPQSLPPLPVPNVPAQPTVDLSTWIDRWQTTNGRVNLSLDGGVLRGQLFLQNMDGSDKEWDRLELRAGAATGQLVGTATYGSLITQVTMTLAADGDSFTATGQVSGQAAYKWSGKRQRLIPKTSTVPASAPNVPVIETLAPQNQTTSQNPPLVLATPVVSLPSTIPTPSANGAGGFLPLRYFKVRIDRVEPSNADNKLEVRCTFKNGRGHAESINGSMISAIVTDADGIGHLGDGSFYRLNGEAELLAGNREVAAQGELKVRLLIDIAPGAAPLKTLTLWETSSQSQTIDISDVQWPQAKPAANLSTLKLSASDTDFKACGEAMDVRFDGFRKSRSGFYEAFFTLKNTADARTRNGVLDLHRGSFDVFTFGDDGAKQLYHELARANGEQATPIVSHYAILSGGETRLRYTFSAKDDVPNPIKVGFADRVSKTSLEWSVASK